MSGRVWPCETEAASSADSSMSRGRPRSSGCFIDHLRLGLDAIAKPLVDEPGGFEIHLAADEFGQFPLDDDNSRRRTELTARAGPPPTALPPSLRASPRPVLARREATTQSSSTSCAMHGTGPPRRYAPRGDDGRRPGTASEPQEATLVGGIFTRFSGRQMAPILLLQGPNFYCAWGCFAKNRFYPPPPATCADDAVQTG